MANYSASLHRLFATLADPIRCAILADGVRSVNKRDEPGDDWSSCLIRLVKAL
jgi:hypothetical protein